MRKQLHCTIVQCASNHRGSQFRFLCAWQAVSAIWGRFLSSEAFCHLRARWDTSLDAHRAVWQTCSVRLWATTFHYISVRLWVTPAPVTQAVAQIGDQLCRKWKTWATSLAADWRCWKHLGPMILFHDLSTIILRPGPVDLCSDLRTPF